MTRCVEEKILAGFGSARVGSPPCSNRRPDHDLSDRKSFAVIAVLVVGSHHDTHCAGLEHDPRCRDGTHREPPTAVTVRDRTVGARRSAAHRSGTDLAVRVVALGDACYAEYKASPEWAADSAMDVTGDPLSDPQTARVCREAMSSLVRRGIVLS